MTVEEQLRRLQLHHEAAAVTPVTPATPGEPRGRVAAQRRRGLATATLDRRTVLAARSPARPSPVDVSRLTKARQRKDDLDIAEMERAVLDAPVRETPAQEIARLRTAGTELDGSYNPKSEVSPPRRHVTVPEDPEEPLIPLEMEAWQKNTERIKAMLAKSSVQNAAAASREVTWGKAKTHVPEPEHIVSMSRALAAEACQRSEAAKVTSPTKGASPSQDASVPGGGSYSTLV